MRAHLVATHLLATHLVATHLVAIHLLAGTPVPLDADMHYFLARFTNGDAVMAPWFMEIVVMLVA